MDAQQLNSNALNAMDTATVDPNAGEGGALPQAAIARQNELLQGVSRTFALNIPQLPAPLIPIVTNAYLLCRIVDTVEDEPNIPWREKSELNELFIAALENRLPPRRFVERFKPLLVAATPAEHRLIEATPQVVAVTHSFTEGQRQALLRCVTLMAEGMAHFQSRRSLAGLASVAELDRYCYHVAGVVGEMLTLLFCDYSPAIAARQQALMSLAVSFGQGLQMTNILKDMWEDRERQMCWLPQEIFYPRGIDLSALQPADASPAFAAGLEQLIGITHGHLYNALCYTLQIPPREAGIRNFCLWAIGMALLTLRNINAMPHFSSGRQVKISRRDVAMTIAVSRLTARHDPLLRLLFRLLARPLPAGDLGHPLSS